MCDLAHSDLFISLEKYGTTMGLFLSAMALIRPKLPVIKKINNKKEIGKINRNLGFSGNDFYS